MVEAFDSQGYQGNTGAENPFKSELINVSIIGESVDDLVVQGIQNIRANGVRIDTTSGPATQAFGANYILLNSRDRVHSLRAPVATRYLSREMLAYFKGSLKVDDGLGQAASFWKLLQDDNGEINSNYGYYIFHEPLGPDVDAPNQYDWAVNSILSNVDSRQAVININQPRHKKPTKDFPCTLGVQYFVRRTPEGREFLCSDISSRSTDIVIGLPYDMGFFSFMTELVWRDLQERGMDNLELGYTVMKSSFTQIYDRTEHLAEQALERQEYRTPILMPHIDSARDLLDDIYNESADTDIMKWIYENSGITPKE